MIEKELAAVDRASLAIPASPTRAEPQASSRLAHVARRGFDVLVATILILLLAPLLLLVAVLIKLDSRGPVLFRQRRMGKDAAPFRVCKFRTMTADAAPELHRNYIAQLAQGDDGQDGALKKLTADPRITRLGRTLRRFSIDELPQLFNVITGDMALVGPRPSIDYELQYYESRHFARFAVRPGITGLWQVSGRNSVGFKEMLDLDAEYAANATFATDLKILARTPLAAVRHAA
jgi:lipopolysaccharide/colanic/teichoic acid biosynthesis glycosyltransferase